MSADLIRSPERYAGCSPEAIAAGSEAQMRFFVADAKADIATLLRRIAALEASATEGERRGWLAAVDALDEIAKAMAEKAEALRSPDPFAVATSEEADAAVHGWVIERAAALLRERIPEAPAREGWRPIETAPKDGTFVLVFGPDDDVTMARWDEDVQQWWRLNNDWTDHWGDQVIATHWQPLPAPPSPAWEPSHEPR